MFCPRCPDARLHVQSTARGALAEVCGHCGGLWMECGQIYEFVPRPEDLHKELEHGLAEQRPGTLACPRCHESLDEGRLPQEDVRVDACPSCGGFWFDATEVGRVVSEADLARLREEPEAEADPRAREKADDRFRGLAAGALALPNLFFRSALTLTLLYGLLGLVLITVVQFTDVSPTLALALGVGFAICQFAFGPWIMDLSLRWLYAFDWLEPRQLPEHLRAFVERVCGEQRMKFPSFGLIRDGAPAAFTYGHHPGNARVVISRGILELLDPAEVEAVVGHELGHARNWDMALMTVANLVPFLLFYLYRFATSLSARGRDKKDYAWLVSLGAYVLFIVSEYVVLWFSRTREYFADRFAGQATGDANALASALVKIAYGLAAQPTKAEDEDSSKKGKNREQKFNHVDALGALNIFDRRAAVGLVMASSAGTDHAAVDREQVKGAMQWDLWNPWAKYYELHSTHPLVAKRLLALADHAAQQGREPFVVFDRRKPQSYWDNFLVDLLVMALPTLGFLAGLIAFGVNVAMNAPVWKPASLVWIAWAVGLAGIGSLVKTAFMYRRDFFPHLSVAALLHKVKVSAVRPVPTTLTGTIIGKGVPGLVWSEDFVLKDRTGILFLNYRQPMAIWNWLFGLFRAGQYQGKQVRVRGWYRRSPVPFLELSHLEVLDGTLPSRRCYTCHARVALGVVLLLSGLAIFVGLLAH